MNTSNYEYRAITNQGSGEVNIESSEVDAHGGTIRIEDNPGGGTIFFITIPLAIEVVEGAEIIED